MKNKYAIIVVSCDKYNCLWDAFFNRFFKYWPKPELPIFLISNQISSSVKNVKSIRVKNINNWSKGLCIALSEIKEEFVYLLLDDIYIDYEINESRLIELVNFLEKGNVNYLNTKGTPYPRGKTAGNKIREIIKGSHYRVSLCNAFWRTETLKSLLKSGENPWQFELNGTLRAEALDGFYGTTDELINYLHVIVGGKLAINLPREELGIKHIENQFTKMNYLEKLILSLSKIRGKIFCIVIPQKIQSRLRRNFANFI